MEHLDLFSGIGGFALATEMVWDNVEHTFCDNEPFAQAVLKKHWPKAQIYGDIRTLRGEDIGAVDLLTGGFPCQPFSRAGLRRGTEDDRDLWPEMFRIIRETKPHWIIGENVAGFVEMELERTCVDLENEGYEVAPPLIIPACAVGANHRRDRVWIVSHSQRPGCQGHNGERQLCSIEDTTQPELGAGMFIGRDNWEGHCRGIRERDGIPTTMARPAVKGYGNAIVPQVAAEIMRAIKQTDDQLHQL